MILALDKALGALAPYAAPDARFHLVVITGGQDNCGADDISTTFSRLRALISKSAFDQTWFNYKFLTFTIGIAFSETEQTQMISARNSTEYAEYPHFLIVVREEQLLDRALGTLSRLSSSELDERRIACADLVRISSEQQDERSATKMRRLCASIINP